MEFALEGDDALQAVLTDVDAYLALNASDGDRQDAAGDDIGAFSESMALTQFLQGDGEGYGENESLFPLEELTVEGDIEELASTPAQTTAITRTTETSSVSLAVQYTQPQSTQLAAVPQRRISGVKTAITKASTTAKKIITWDPNKARNERKGELIYLRKKVAELESQLTQLQTNKRLRIDDSAAHSSRACASSSPSSVSSHTQQQLLQTTHSNSQQLKFKIPSHVVPSTGSIPETYVWQEIANRQSNERVKSERENIRLKIVLENQIKIAKSLEKHLKRATTTAELEKHNIQGCTNDVHPAGNVYPSGLKLRTTSEIFNDLLAGVEQCYAEVDSVFASNGLASSELTSIVAKMRPDCDRRMFMEICSTKALPFDLHTTASAVWNHYVHAKERIPSRHYCYKTPKSTDPTDDTIVENFNLSVEVNGTKAKFCTKQIMRRYFEAKRVVIVWCTTFAPIEFSCESLSGVRFLEKGYVVIKHPSLRTDGLSLLQTCYVVKPLSAGDGLDGDHPHFAAITDFVLSSTALSISASDQMIENELLQQALRGSAYVG
uniref:M96 mating-specific protein family n=1 Tax=Globisporangium ultimum (strain ATCC 200006 / CBS 805.95 / DAOM BR144) TaxID=431595 RepID=K3W8U3_GLOUD